MSGLQESIVHSLKLHFCRRLFHCSHNKMLTKEISETYVADSAEEGKGRGREVFLRRRLLVPELPR